MTKTVQDWPITIPSDIKTLATEILTRLHAALGESLVGLYLTGSIVTGDYDPGVSDIDLIAVIPAPLDETQFAALAAAHQAILARHPNWDDRLEILYYTTAGLRTFRTEASPIAVISPGEPFNRKLAGDDWLMNWYLLREHSHTLYGPPPAQLVNPIAPREFLHAVYAHACAWPTWIEAMRDDCQYQAYGVLTMCRTAYTLHTGAHVSKRKAATWAIQRWPVWADVIQRALTWRIALPEDADALAVFATNQRFIHFVAREINTVIYPDSQ